MTRDRDFKRLVRERASREGEPYVLARRRLIDGARGSTSTAGGLSEDVYADLGTHRLHALVRRGSGPAIVLDAGQELPYARVWDPLVAELGDGVTTVAYDRAGHGGSTAGPRPRTPDRIASELREMLSLLQVEGPRVMVANGRSSLYGLRLALRDPGLAALVLIEPPWPPPQVAPEGSGSLGVWIESRIVAGLAGFGPAVRVALRHVDSPEIRTTLGELRADPVSRATTRAEADGCRDQLRFRPQDVGTLAKVPTSVVTGSTSPYRDAWMQWADATQGRAHTLPDPGVHVDEHARLIARTVIDVVRDIG